MLRVDFHCHTCYSKDSLAPPERLLAACRKRGLDRLVITDHNTIAGALHAQKLEPEGVIVGEEIMTLEGELLAYYVTQEVPPNLSPEETIAILRDQGAFISVAHPFDVTRSGHWQADALLRILPLVDAIEIFNARCLKTSYNARAAAFAREHGILGTAGSDAHAVFELGKASLILPDFHDPASLKASLTQAELQASFSSPFVHFASVYAEMKKKVTKAAKSLTLSG